MWSGWGPDYADPNTYLHTVCIDGDIVENFGFAETELHTATAAALNKLGKSDVNTVAWNLDANAVGGRHGIEACILRFSAGV